MIKNCIYGQKTEASHVNYTVQSRKKNIKTLHVQFYHLLVVGFNKYEINYLHIYYMSEHLTFYLTKKYIYILFFKNSGKV